MQNMTSRILPNCFITLVLSTRGPQTIKKLSFYLKKTFQAHKVNKQIGYLVSKKQMTAEFITNFAMLPLLFR